MRCIQDPIHGTLPILPKVLHPNYTDDPEHNTREESEFGTPIQKQIQMRVTNGLGYQPRGHYIPSEAGTDYLERYLFEMDVKTGEIHKKVSSNGELKGLLDEFNFVWPSF